ncbi:MAG: PQQ-binding-like beta-propeller repeat protein [Deltaproteobacteria bacterium]|nr:PQQ-binding-like beta-propeller repeat protein [Deltaproteobacteria bacterium]
MVLASMAVGAGCQPSQPVKQGEAQLARPAAKTAAKAEDMPKHLEMPDGEDVLAKTLEMNSAKYAPPPTEWRKGHVTKAKLAPSAIKRSKGRFEVRLPSGAPIATPTVYRNKVMVSGGFRSKQFYALKVETGEPVWGLQLDDDGPSTAACAERICVWNTESCTIFAVEADTGKMLWSWWLGDPLMSAPTIDGGRVFTAYPARAAAPRGTSKAPKAPPPGASHALVALDLKTGSLLWQRWIDSDVMSAPVAVKGALYVASQAGTLYKFDQVTGKVLAAKARRATSAPVIDASGVYYTRRLDDPDDQDTVEEGVVSERPEGDDSDSGTYMGGGGYVTHKKAAPYLSPKVQKKSSYGKQSFADDAANGFGSGAPAAANASKAAYNIGQSSVSSLQAFQGSRILRFGALSVSSMGDEVVGLDAATGKKNWSFKLKGDAKAAGGFLAAPPAAAGNRIFIGTLAGKIQTVEPKSGARKKAYDAKHPIRSQPVIHQGWIYVGTTDGWLVAIDTGNDSLTGWSTWGKDAARTGRL